MADKMVLNKSKLAGIIAKRLRSKKISITKLQVETIIDEMINEIVSILKEGGQVELRGFGIFSVKSRKAKKARNLKTGEEIMVPPRKVPVFKYSKKIVEEIKSS